MIEALLLYLSEIQNERFAWGEHDCFTFTNEAWRRMYGRQWADPAWSAAYVDPYGLPVALCDLARRFPAYKAVSDAVDVRLRRIDHTPPRGALVAAYGGEGRWRLGTAFGIAAGTHAAFLGARGVRYLPIDEITHAWVNRHDHTA